MGTNVSNPKKYTSGDVKYTPDVCKKWREHGYENWNQEAVSKIRDEIITMVTKLEATDEIKIILCGGTGEGKSSLINNLIAAIKGYFAVLALHGDGQYQVTKWYKQHYTTTEEQGRMRRLPLCFADTRGFSASTKHGASVAAIQACIMGQVANEEEIDPEKTDTEWQQRDAKVTKASFIFFVANATFVPDDGNLGRVKSRETTYKNLQQIRTFSLNEKIGVAAFLTNCDTLDDVVNNDVSNLYYSNKVEKKVEAFSKMIDVPRYRTYPIVNYKHSSNVTDTMVMQALIPLKDCLQDIRSNMFS